MIERKVNHMTIRPGPLDVPPYIYGAYRLKRPSTIIGYGRLVDFDIEILFVLLYKL